MLLTALATLTFLAALGLAGLALVSTLIEDRAKVVAALKGRSLMAEPLVATRPVTVRFSPRPAPARRTVAAQPSWRVAA